MAHDSADLRVYWSQVANPETLVEGASRKPAELKYQQVLREAALRTTALALPFPSVAEEAESIDGLVAEQQESYVEVLTRLADLIQYELTATWADDERADLSVPVKG